MKKFNKNTRILREKNKILKKYFENVEQKVKSVLKKIGELEKYIEFVENKKKRNEIINEKINFCKMYDDLKFVINETQKFNDYFNIKFLKNINCFLKKQKLKIQKNAINFKKINDILKSINFIKNSVVETKKYEKIEYLINEKLELENIYVLLKVENDLLYFENYDTCCLIELYNINLIDEKGIKCINDFETEKYDYYNKISKKFIKKEGSKFGNNKNISKKYFDIILNIAKYKLDFLQGRKGYDGISIDADYSCYIDVSSFSNLDLLNKYFYNIDKIFKEDENRLIKNINYFNNDFWTLIMNREKNSQSIFPTFFGTKELICAKTIYKIYYTHDNGEEICKIDDVILSLYHNLSGFNRFFFSDNIDTKQQQFVEYKDVLSSIKNNIKEILGFLKKINIDEQLLKNFLIDVNYMLRDIGKKTKINRLCEYSYKQPYCVGKGGKRRKHYTKTIMLTNVYDINFEYGLINETNEKEEINKENINVENKINYIIEDEKHFVCTGKKFDILEECNVELLHEKVENKLITDNVKNIFIAFIKKLQNSIHLFNNYFKTEKISVDQQNDTQYSSKLKKIYNVVESLHYLLKKQKISDKFLNRLLNDIYLMMKVDEKVEKENRLMRYDTKKTYQF